MTQTHPAPATAVPPSWWRAPRLLVAVGIAALVLIVLAAGAAVAVALRLADDDGHAVSGPLDGRREATLELLDGATTIIIRAVDLGDQLYRAVTPDDSHLRPRAVDGGDRIQIRLGSRGEVGPSAVEVRLHSGVRWSVRIVGGATEEIVNLSAGRLAGLEIVGGVRSAEVFLPPARGTVPVRMSGGAGDLVLHAPAGTPARVSIGAGAGSVTVDGTVHNGVSAGGEFASADWAGAADRYDIVAAAGVSTLTVNHR